MLEQIPDLAAEVVATAGTRPITDEGARPRRVPGSVVLADLDRMMVLDGANDHDGLGVLSTWVRAILDELGEAGSPPDAPEGTVEACCAWLGGIVPWASSRGFWGEFRADIGRLHKALSLICKRRKPYRPHCRYCTNPVQGIDPDGQTTDNWNLASYGRCSGCGMTYPKGPALQALGKLQDLTVPELAQRFGIGRQAMREAITRWQARGLITPSGKQGKAKLYPLARVAQLRQEKVLTLHSCVRVRPKTAGGGGEISPAPLSSRAGRSRQPPGERQLAAHRKSRNLPPEAQSEHMPQAACELKS